jgi:hypothetical protein
VSSRKTPLLDKGARNNTLTAIIPITKKYGKRSECLINDLLYFVVEKRRRKGSSSVNAQS